jgi:hypothetical protein
MDLQSDQKMALSVRTCIRACTVVAQSDTMVAAVHRMLQCAAMASNVAQFKDKILVRVWTGMRPRMPWLSILSPEWEDKPSRETKVLYWNAVATLFRPLAEACKDSSDDEDDGSGLEDFVRHTNCECSAGPRLLLELSMSLQDTAEI